MNRQATRLRYLAEQLEGDSGPDQAVIEQPTDWIAKGDDTPALADLAHAILEARLLRASHLPPNLFGEPGWNMLLDLFRALHVRQRVPITSLCIASGAPTTTALRWIQQLKVAGLITKSPSDNDARVTYIELSADGAALMRSALRSIVRNPTITKRTQSDFQYA